MKIKIIWKIASGSYNKVRIIYNVFIRPFTDCDSVGLDDKYCYSGTEKATIVLKSQDLFFFISYKFTMENVILDGADLVIF